MLGNGAKRCHARSRSGVQCGQAAMAGQAVCYWHGGAAPQAKAAALRRLALAQVKAEVESLGIPLDVDPGTALLGLLSEAAGNVAVYRRLVQELEPGFSTDGSGIAGPDDPAKWTARRHVLVALYDDERDRLARYAELALRAGVEERRVRIAETEGQVLATVILAMLEDPGLGLTHEQRETGRRLAGTHLRALTAVEDGGS